MRNLPHLAQARDDTIAIGVSTPGVYVIERSARAGLRAHRYREQPTEWLALCVSEDDGRSMDVLRVGGNGGKKLGSLGAGHHYMTCFVAVRTQAILLAWARPSATIELTRNAVRRA